MRPMRSRVYLVRGRGRVRVRAIFRPAGCTWVWIAMVSVVVSMIRALNMATLTKGVPEQE